MLLALAGWYLVVPVLAVDLHGELFTSFSFAVWTILMLGAAIAARGAVHAPSGVLVCAIVGFAALAVVCQHFELALVLRGLTKVAFAITLGYFLSLIAERLAWVLPIVLFASISDLWSVFSTHGVTNALTTSQETHSSGLADQLWDLLMIPLPHADLDIDIWVGAVDVVLAAFLIGVAHLFRLGVRRTAIVLGCGLVFCAFSVQLFGVGLPAVPFMALGFLVANAPMILRDRRNRRSGAATEPDQAASDSVDEYAA